MMTFEQVMAIIEPFAQYADIEVEDGDIYVSVHDFDGFDDDWSEIMIDYDTDLEDSILEVLDAECVSSTDGMYPTWVFDGFTVHWEYESYDI